MGSYLFIAFTHGKPGVEFSKSGAKFQVFSSGFSSQILQGQNSTLNDSCSFELTSFLVPRVGNGQSLQLSGHSIILLCNSQQTLKSVLSLICYQVLWILTKYTRDDKRIIFREYVMWMNVCQNLSNSTVHICIFFCVNYDNIQITLCVVVYVVVYTSYLASVCWYSLYTWVYFFHMHTYSYSQVLTVNNSTAASLIQVINRTLLIWMITVVF